MKLKCRNCNYTWLTNFKNANRIRKCIKCSGFAKYSIKEIVEILNNKNIIWVDKKGYKDNHSILKFKCKKCNCLWNTAFCHININKTGCSNCSSCKTEKLCRKYLEGKFKVQFSKISPEWLNGLQLDGYNEKLNIAFEYNGRQHYEHVKYFHTKKEFIAQQQRDVLKRKILKEKGIPLIDIPYTYNCRKEEKLYKFIDDMLEKLKITSK